jgi:hypothetical protein
MSVATIIINRRKTSIMSVSQCMELGPALNRWDRLVEQNCDGLRDKE